GPTVFLIDYENKRPKQPRNMGKNKHPPTKYSKKKKLQKWPKQKNAQTKFNPPQWTTPQQK
ncbi:hypothetical protein Q4578_20860, partial [Shimia thalassica]|uniref:hypothetical protein n=1 Tax=Shimia thalassica TaxID=1715693 RepID=UPI0026E23D40